MAFWIVVVSAVIVGLLAAVVLSRIRFRIRYSRSGELDQLFLIVRALFGMFRYQIQIPSIWVRGWNLYRLQHTSGTLPGQPQVKTVQRPIRARKMSGSGRQKAPVKALRPWLLRTLKQVECTRFRLDFRVGTGDAPSTAIASALLWTLQGCATALTGQMIRLKARPTGVVHPVYDGTEFGVLWEAEFQMRMMSALWSTLKLGRRALSIRRDVGYWMKQLAGP